MTQTSLRAAAQALQKMGNGKDTILAHITPREAAILKANGGAGTINKKSGLMQFDPGDGGGDGGDGGDGGGGDSNGSNGSDPGQGSGAMSGKGDDSPAGANDGTGVGGRGGFGGEVGQTMGARGYTDSGVLSGAMGGFGQPTTGLGFLDNKINDVVNNPAAAAINAGFGFVPGIGTLNTLSALFNGPSVGNMAMGGLQTAKDAFGGFTGGTPQGGQMAMGGGNGLTATDASFGGAPPGPAPQSPSPAGGASGPSFGQFPATPYFAGDPYFAGGAPSVNSKTGLQQFAFRKSGDMNPNLAMFAQMAQGGQQRPPMLPQGGMPPQPQMPPQGAQGGGNPVMAAARPELKQAAQQGEDGDDTLAHVTKGEMVVPKEVQTPKVLAELKKAFEQAGADPAQYVVGAPQMQMNSATGAPQFGFSFADLLPILGGGAAAFFAPELLPMLGMSGGSLAGTAALSGAGSALGGLAAGHSGTQALAEGLGGGVGTYLGGGGLGEMMGKPAAGSALGGLAAGQSGGSMFGKLAGGALGTVGGGILGAPAPNYNPTGIQQDPSFGQPMTPQSQLQNFHNLVGGAPNGAQFPTGPNAYQRYGYGGAFNFFPS